MKKLIVLCSLVLAMFVSGVFVNAANPAEVKVSISSSVDNENRNIGGIPQNKKVGDILDLNASALNGSNNFAYWVINGFVRADLKAICQLKVQSKMSVLGIFHTSEEHAVLFVDSNGKLIHHVYVSDEGAAEAPDIEGLSKPGGLVVDIEAPWKTLDGLTTSLEGIDSSRIYVLQYTLAPAELEIVAIGATIEWFTANRNDVVTVVAADESTFTHWADEDGNVLSYNSTYSFTALEEEIFIEAKDTTITPASFVTMKDLTGIRSGHESYGGRFELHGDDEIIEYGFIMSSTETGAITIDSAGVRFAKSNTHNPVTNEFLMSFPLVNFLSIRAYALIYNAEGLTYIYNDIPGSYASDLFISEYIEGSSSNKAIEIYNGTGASVDLSVYTLSLFSNGSNLPTNSIPLSGTLAKGDVYVIYNSASASAIIDKGDIGSTVTNFNGDDAVALYKNGIIIDVFGIIGIDPGTSWNVGEGTTADHTLVRKSSVSGPSTTWISSEWDVYPVDTFTYLGSHLMEGTAVVFSDSQIILLDAMNLDQFLPIKQSGTITLPTVGGNGSTITWSSNSTHIIDNEGNVFIPEGMPETVILTATISKGGLSKNVTRSVEVGLTYVERVADDKETLTLESLTINEPGTITLPSTGLLHNSTISWVSSNTDIITNDGVVTLPTSGSADVLLTATISYGTTDPCIETKEFTVKVFAISEVTKETLVISTTGTGQISASGLRLDSAIFNVSSNKNSAGTAPTRYADSIRIYYSSTGDGGSITFELTGYVIESITIHALSSYRTTTRIIESLDGTVVKNVTNSFDTDGNIVVNGLMDKVTIQNANTTNVQLRIDKITIVYRKK